MLSQRLTGPTPFYAGCSNVSSYFRLDSRLETEIERVIGADRFGFYLATAGSQAEALRLYSWNAAIASAFLGPIAMIEVALRNAISQQLRKTFGPAWYDDAAFLAFDGTPRTQSSVSTAKQRIARAVPARRITLLRPALNRTLWPSLQPAFSRYTHRRSLVRYLEPLVPFRNRIAHHEPIFNRRPAEMYDGVLLLADMISEDLRGWIEHHARIRTVLADGPVTTGVKF